MNDSLTTAHKNVYPFTLSCPSFIYPAGYSDNVRRLGASVDEIELLLLESNPTCLPPAKEIRALAGLAREQDLTFNIHLPTDVSLAAVEQTRREQALAGICRALDLSRELEPTSLTLHLPGPDRPDEPEQLSAWQDRLEEAAVRLLEQSDLPASRFALENLDYPFSWLDRLLDRFDFAVCMDTGHLMFHHQDCLDFFQRYRHRIAIIHTHGVAGGRDHLALNRLNQRQTRDVSTIFSSFQRSLSLEVFNLPDLAASLDYLAGIWDNIKNKSVTQK
ncbi:MAG: cobamide remodeling phosphodiesterase CbiR [Desulfosudaceae bacterium]